MKRLLCLFAGVAVLFLVAGCAATHTGSVESSAAGEDGRTVRGLVDTIQSTPHTYPANFPR